MQNSRGQLSTLSPEIRPFLENVDAKQLLVDISYWGRHVIMSFKSPWHLLIYAIISLSYHIISYHIISYHIMSYHYHIISLSYHYHVMSYHIISYHIISYNIISHPFASPVSAIYITSTHHSNPPVFNGKPAFGSTVGRTAATWPPREGTCNMGQGLVAHSRQWVWFISTELLFF